ncbi:hypothetical protein KAI56_01040 [Candidatus Parcubacteria bacterium]|nr:hypothetical protein [Candidatus Parcubacteria bacterium]
MKKFIKREWFKIIMIILLSIVVISYASCQYVYYQKQQIQLQEMRQEIQKEQRAKEKLYPVFLKIQELKKTNQDEAKRMVDNLSDEEWRIYKLLKAELD